jgi:hypothetical protein
VRSSVETVTLKGGADRDFRARDAALIGYTTGRVAIAETVDTAYRFAGTAVVGNVTTARSGDTDQVAGTDVPASSTVGFIALKVKAAPRTV